MTLLVVTIVIIIYGMFIYPNLIELLCRGAVRNLTVLLKKKTGKRRRRPLKLRKPTFSVAANNYGPPLMQKMSTYTKGFGSYDDSFTIEDAEEKFLGETGALIAEGVTTDGSSTALKCGCSTRTTLSAR